MSGGKQRKIWINGLVAAYGVAESLQIFDT